jgi:hypothetical protein
MSEKYSNHEPMIGLIPLISGVCYAQFKLYHPGLENLGIKKNSNNNKIILCFSNKVFPRMYKPL